MRHVRPITQSPRPAGVTPLESLILLVLTSQFSTWTNFPQVIRALQKYYAKT